MADHVSRGHATWSASSTDRFWNCAGALALSEGVPDRTSEASDWGTCAHQIADECLKTGIDADSFIGTVQKGKVHEFTVDEEMAETAQIFVDYVREKAGLGPGETVNDSNLVDAERYFSLAAVAPPMDAGGTADAIIFEPAEDTLEVVDLKGGLGVIVEVKGNPQALTYALGAMLANRGRAVTWVKSTIVQPRAPHKDGRIRSDTIHVADLIEWSTDLLAAMEQSAEARAAFTGTADAEWRKAYLNAGDHCKFCPAAGFCPELEQRSLDMAQVWFDDLSQPQISNTPDMLSPERAAQLLSAADMINEWINAVRSFWHDQAEKGVTVPGYVLVDKQGREKWKEGVEDKVRAAAQQAGLDASTYQNVKLRTPKQIRKALGAENEHLVKDLSVTPKTGTNLVRREKTSREPVKSAVDKFFDDLG